MQATELESQGLKKSFKVVVDAASVNAQMEAELRAAGERVKIPGFRPGYIPLGILKQRYGKSVQQDVVKRAISQASNQLLSEHGLRPAAAPGIKIEEYKEGNDLVFTVSLETLPPIPEVDFGAVRVERETFDVTDADVEQTIARILKRNPRLVRRGHGATAQTGDVAVIDFKGMIDGKAFAGGSAEGFRLELGGGQFVNGFEEQLIGALEGDDKIVTVMFPADYPGANVAGKEASFAVKVHELLGKEEQELSEEFAQEYGFADLTAYREAVRAQTARDYDQIVRGRVKKRLFDVLDEMVDFEVPQSMFDLEFNSIWERLMEARNQGDPSLANQPEEELKAEYRAIARRRVKLGLLLAEVASRNNIRISRGEMSRAVEQQARQFPGQEKRVMDFYRANPERMDDLQGPILEEKAVDFILTKISFNDRKCTLAEIYNLDAPDGEVEDNEGSASEKTANSTKPKKDAKQESDGKSEANKKAKKKT